MAAEGGGDSDGSACRRWDCRDVSVVVIVIPAINLCFAIYDLIGPFDAIDGFSGGMEDGAANKQAEREEKLFHGVSF